MIINPTVQAFLRNEARERFLRYVRIETTSDENSGTHPSSETQWNLARMVKEELEALQLQDVMLDEYCYVYGTLPASEGVTAPPITFCAHLDTSSSESGKQVKPVLHEHYDGGILTFPENPELKLSPETSPELKKYCGQTIITASGTTLLGADDKAGIAEIMAALAALQEFKDFSHPELRIVFTPDEEIGEGALHIKKEKLGQYGYTLDGGDMGELEDECFDALRATLIFHGVNVHPGTAKNRMVNAAAIAARFVAMLPEYETPEHTDIREGFYHLTHISGEENLSEIQFILRDFEPAANLKRAELLQHLIQVFELRYPGLRIELHLKEQYKNMREILQKYPEVTSKAEQAIEMAGVELIKKAIRGGTDGARFSFQGMPTPNLFAGGVLAHSKKEWIPEIALQKAAEVILYVCELWAKDE